MEIKGYDRAYAAINLDHVVENLNSMKRVIYTGTKVCAVVKTDGYGHGASFIAHRIADMVWGFAVATPEEALDLRHHGILNPIIVLGYVNPCRFEEMIQNQVRLPLFEYNKVKQFSEAAKRVNQTGYIHIKVDTGMGRLGLFPNEDSLKTIKEMSKLPGICLEGIFTHMATADMKDNHPALHQIDVFKRFCNQVTLEGVNIAIHHCDNSAGTMTLPQGDFDMCRIGISMYGLYPSNERDWSKTPIVPVMSLYSQVIYVKELPEGTPIGYGETYQTPSKKKIATISIGYGDGYPRGLSNKGQVLIHGTRCDIVGRICMDQLMVDVTELSDVKEGDVVTLIGNDGKETISMEELAEKSGRFNYEFACDLGKRVPRVFYQEGKIIGTKDYFLT